MHWTEATRREYRRDMPRYASDLSDREWALIAPLMPAPKRIGRPRTTDLREVMNAILYIASTGCQWAMLPKDLPPYSTVQRYFYEWRDSGLLQMVRFALAMETHDLEGCEAQPSAGVIDSQSVKTTEHGGARGFDARKKINGRKRHSVVDTIGLLFGLLIAVFSIRYLGTSMPSGGVHPIGYILTAGEPSPSRSSRGVSSPATKDSTLRSID